MYNLCTFNYFDLFYIANDFESCWCTIQLGDLKVYSTLSEFLKCYLFTCELLGFWIMVMVMMNFSMSFGHQTP